MNQQALQTTDVNNEPVKKELKIYKVKNSALFCVAYEGGGELPKELKQRWTSPKLAQEAIEQYEMAKELRIQAAAQRIVEEELRAAQELEEAEEAKRRAAEEVAEAKKRAKAAKSAKK
jgi:hypothetical protein